MSTSGEVTPQCAGVRQQGVLAGHLKSTAQGGWQFSYLESYQGPPVSLTLPVRREPYSFPAFPAVFEGLLPEGPQLEALLRRHKIDRHDAFRLLVTVGRDLVGSLTVEEESSPAS
jgi:serine/threonine-protein kinase HipA